MPSSVSVPFFLPSLTFSLRLPPSLAVFNSGSLSLPSSSGCGTDSRLGLQESGCDRGTCLPAPLCREPGRVVETKFFRRESVSSSGGGVFLFHEPLAVLAERSWREGTGLEAENEGQQVSVVWVEEAGKAAVWASLRQGRHPPGWYYR